MSVPDASPYLHRNSSLIFDNRCYISLYNKGKRLFEWKLCSKQENLRYKEMSKDKVLLVLRPKITRYDSKRVIEIIGKKIPPLVFSKIRKDFFSKKSLEYAFYRSDLVSLTFSDKDIYISYYPTYEYIYNSKTDRFNKILDFVVDYFVSFAYEAIYQCDEYWLSFNILKYNGKHNLPM